MFLRLSFLKLFQQKNALSVKWDKAFNIYYKGNLLSID